MHVIIHLSNQLIAEAVYQLLVTNGYDDVVVDGRCPADVTPGVLLVDISTLTHDLLARYPAAKVLLMDTGIGPEETIAVLSTYKIQGVLSSHAQFQLLKKALKAVSEGQVWIDGEPVKALLDDTGAISRSGKISGATDREKRIIEYICQGLSNKEIARRLTLSPHTVKTHLNNIFRKFNVTSRTKLMSLATHRP